MSTKPVDFATAAAQAKQRVEKIDTELADIHQKIRMKQLEVKQLTELREKLTIEANKIRYVLGLPASASTPKVDEIPA